MWPIWKLGHAGVYTKREYQLRMLISLVNNSQGTQRKSRCTLLQIRQRRGVSKTLQSGITVRHLLSKKKKEKQIQIPVFIKSPTSLNSWNYFQEFKTKTSFNFVQD